MNSFLENRGELAKRSSGGIEVTLYWTAGDNQTTIEIWHDATEERALFRQLALAARGSMKTASHPKRTAERMASSSSEGVRGYSA